jgi:hypothetical protein
MAIKAKDDLLNSLNEMFKDNTSDETLSLIEDITDTFNDYETKTKDATNWEQKYNDNDKAWRQRYKERFFNSPPKDEHFDDEEDDKPEPKTFEDLFKTK